MFEKAMKQTEWKGYQQIEYCRFTDDTVILVNGHEALKWLVEKALRRLKQELKRLQVDLNMEKTKILDLEKGETFSFLGFDYCLGEHKEKKVNELIDKVPTHIAQNRHKSVYFYSLYSVQ